jgi:hypothetical protein
MQYRLSNAQQKELLIRGQQLTIAVPTLDTDDADIARQFAERSLPEVSEHIADAWVQLIRVALPGAGKGLTGKLGVILPEGALPKSEQITVNVEVCLVSLRPPRCRGELKKVQWPGWLLED